MYAVIHPIEPFDASKGATINFTWNGNQIRYVHCIIKENDSGETVYDETVENMKQQYNVPSDSTLSNGKYYVAYITVLDVDHIESEQQAIGTPFYCFSTPKFSLSVQENAIVRASAYSVSAIYSQTEDEPLDSYRIMLYDHAKKVLQDSGSIYDTTSLQYIVSGLENAKQYYVRSTGVTLHGMNIDTGFIPFSVSYNQAQVFSPLESNNMPDIGAIEIKSNIISTQATSEKPVGFLDGERVDLRDNSIVYDVGFEIEGNHSSIYLFEKPNLNTSLVRFFGEQTEAMIVYREGAFSDSDGKKAYFELRVKAGGRFYVLMSNYVDIPSDDQQFSLLVNREGNLYEVKAVLVKKRGAV